MRGSAAARAAKRMTPRAPGRRDGPRARPGAVAGPGGAASPDRGNRLPGPGWTPDPVRLSWCCLDTHEGMEPWELRAARSRSRSSPDCFARARSTAGSLRRYSPTRMPLPSMSETSRRPRLRKSSNSLRRSATSWSCHRGRLRLAPRTFEDEQTTAPSREHRLPHAFQFASLAEAREPVTVAESAQAELV